MPHLRFRGVTETCLAGISESLVNQLSGLLGCDRANFTLECVSSVFVFDGAKVIPEPMVEVLWFARPQSVQDQFAGIITQSLRDAGESQDIAVFFQTLQPQAYYDNAEHY